MIERNKNKKNNNMILIFVSIGVIDKKYQNLEPGFEHPNSTLLISVPSPHSSYKKGIVQNQFE